MPLLTKEGLLAQLTAAVTQAGWQIAWLGPPSAHPFRFNAIRDDQSLTLRTYVWNLTHGGGPARPEDEYRIQVTGVSSFEEEPGGVTVILGWWDEAGVWAAFDVRFHLGELGYSPSIQIRREALREACERGLATQVKGNNEIAVAIRPDLVMHYVQNARALHGFGQSEHDRDILEAAIANPYGITDADIAAVSPARQTAVVTTRRVLRERSFRNRVLAAYEHRCAVCAVQLGLVEAAHIVPAALEHSTDETANGIAFCPNHHKAYDTSLITIHDDHSVLLSKSRLASLEATNLLDGLDAFQAALCPFIFLPAEQYCRPRPEYLKMGRDLRGWRE